ncbi:MAG TPA: M23 family metallopeptidase [Pseudolabrys sp.]|nr:M23 family metallopeptidase [Pseudolabrys sp.]
MPDSDAVNSCASKIGGEDEGRLLKRTVFVTLALLVSGPVAAGEMESPIITLSHVNWNAATASLTDHGTQPPAEAFGRLNANTSKRFAGIDKSTVPVLLPFDTETFRQDLADGKAEATTSEKYFGAFHPTKFFLAGPAGYDATFTLSNKEDGLKIGFEKPILFEISGAAFVYNLDPPNHVEKEEPIPKELDQQFPGIRRILSEAYVRYVFERFGVPYVLSIQCYDMRPSSRRLSCRQADPLAVRFLSLLRTAGGTPAKIQEPETDLSRPTTKSDFTFYGPGDLIENTGWKKMPGRVDYHVYARMRYPIAYAPSYVKSQSFLPWGDCYRTGMAGRMGRKGAPYQCKVNGQPLVFDESAAVNFTYPWRDNFCEQRDFLVGQCPGGYGHQGEDIRPAQCVLNNAAADRCLPYQDLVAAVHDGVIRRLPGDLGVYIVVNTENEHVRFRYLHMNPKFMDTDGLLNGRQVSEGEIIGKVANWGDYDSGTSYHLHFNIQVFTKIGWVWVNPYMTLVAAYERLVGGRGTEIKAGEPAPAIPVKLPVILHPTPPAQAPAASALPPATPGASAAPPVKVVEAAAERTKPHKRHRIHRVRHKRRHKSDG